MMALQNNALFDWLKENCISDAVRTDTSKIIHLGEATKSQVPLTVWLMLVRLQGQFEIKRIESAFGRGFCIICIWIKY